VFAPIADWTTANGVDLQSVITFILQANIDHIAMRSRAEYAGIDAGTVWVTAKHQVADVAVMPIVSPALQRLLIEQVYPIGR
jgi:hypothetical protein